MPGGDLDKLTGRHRIAAALEATGLSNRAIAAHIGVSENWLSVVRNNSSLYRALVEEESAALRERLQGTKHDELTALWPKAIAAKHDLLNQRENLSVLNAASDSVLDRVLPRRRA